MCFYCIRARHWLGLCSEHEARRRPRHVVNIQVCLSSDVCKVKFLGKSRFCAFFPMGRWHNCRAWTSVASRRVRVCCMRLFAVDRFASFDFHAQRSLRKVWSQCFGKVADVGRRCKVQMLVMTPCAKADLIRWFGLGGLINAYCTRAQRVPSSLNISQLVIRGWKLRLQAFVCRRVPF